MTIDLHDLTGAYATGALPADERLRLEEHLRVCPRCTQETRELLETTALLGLAAAMPPPPHLRACVLAEAAATAQLPPLLSTRRATQPTARRASLLARRWPLGVAACLAGLAIGIGTYTGLPNSGPRPAGQVQAVQAAPGARTLTVTTAAASATVTLDAANTRMTFTARGLREPGPGRTYQLWLLEPDGPRPAATFTPSAGTATAVINGPGSAGTVLVTEEPAGGSAQPTTQPILAVDLRQA